MGGIPRVWQMPPMSKMVVQNSKPEQSQLDETLLPQESKFEDKDVAEVSQFEESYLPYEEDISETKSSLRACVTFELELETMPELLPDHSEEFRSQFDEGSIEEELFSRLVRRWEHVQIGKVRPEESCTYHVSRGHDSAECPAAS